MRRKSIFVVIIIVTLAIVILMGTMYFMVISGAIFSFMSNPPMPEITYGEFPFCITYELDGEIKVIKDTLICEYAGAESRGSAGKYRKWKSHLKSGNERITLLHDEESNLSFEITTTIGLPEYYMGDFRQSKEEYERAMEDDRYLGYVQWKDGIQTGRSIPKEEAWEKYNVKLIKKEYSAPIENTFR